MNMTDVLRRKAALSIAVALAACSTGQVGPAERAVRTDQREAVEALAQARSVMASFDERPVRISDGVFSTAVARRSDTGFPLPARFERPDGFVLIRSDPMTLQEISSAISEITGIPVLLAPDLSSAVRTAQEISPAQQAAAMTPLPGAPAGAAAMGAALGATNAARMRVDHQGSLSSFLQRVAAHFGINWEYNRREIKLSYFVTRTFVVHALPADINLLSRLDVNNTVQASSGGAGQSGSGEGSGVSGGTSQQMSSEVALRIWRDLTQSVESILAGQGRMATSPSTGAIVVTAPRAIMDRVQAFMEAQNQRLSRQVTVNVQVLSVDLNDGSDTRFDLQAIANDLIARGLAVSLGTPTSIANPAAPGIGFAVTSGRAQGTEAVLQALASRGRVSVRTATTVTTLNGIPAPVNVTNTRGYLAEIALSQVPGFGGGTGGGGVSSGVQASLRPGSVTTGFSLNILPRIDRDGQSLLMQFSVNISELVGPRDGFNEFSAPGLGAIQLPNINSRSFVQQAEVQSGQTIIVTGFERAGETAERQGAVFSEFIGAGGSQVGTRRRTSIVVLMTPRIVSSRPAISME
jgi:type IVB pilus formation R64 PilN family outer membrane protein